MVEADRGYGGEPRKVRTPDDHASMSDKRAKEKSRARHETINKRLKQFGCLKKSFVMILENIRLYFRLLRCSHSLALKTGRRHFRFRANVVVVWAHYFVVMHVL